MGPPSMSASSRSRSPPLSLRGRSRCQVEEDKARAHVLAVADGRDCKLCGGKDDEPDPTSLKQFRLWGYPPKQIEGVLRNQGRCCYICMRVFQGRYHPKHILKNMPTVLGSSQEEHDRFNKFSTSLLHQIREKGSLNFRIDWEVEEQLYHISVNQTVWEDPADLFIPLADYIMANGDPKTNGLGHSSAKNRKGVDCVVVPESNIQKRKVQRVEKASLQRCIDNGKNQVGEGQLLQKFEDLGNVIRMACGSASSGGGTSLAFLLSASGSGGNLGGSLFGMLSAPRGGGSAPAVLQAGGVGSERSPAGKKGAATDLDNDDDDLAPARIVIPGFCFSQASPQVPAQAGADAQPASGSAGSGKAPRRGKSAAAPAVGTTKAAPGSFDEASLRNICSGMCTLAMDVFSQNISCFDWFWTSVCRATSCSWRFQMDMGDVSIASLTAHREDRIASPWLMCGLGISLSHRVIICLRLRWDSFM